jgi:hypothetical protein
VSQFTDAVTDRVRERFGLTLTPHDYLVAVAEVIPEVVEAWLDQRFPADPEVIGETEHGDKVYLRQGIFEYEMRPRYAGDGHPSVRAAAVPPCVDGKPVHDLQGNASCPRCGFTPKVILPVSVGYEPDPSEPEPEVQR